MTIFKATVTEKTSPSFGKVFATTKIGQYKGMGKEEFYAAIRYNQSYTFEVVEL